MRKIIQPRPYLGQTASGKWVCAQNRKHQIGTWKNFQKEEITGKDSICSKKLKLKEKQEK